MLFLALFLTENSIIMVGSPSSLFPARRGGGGCAPFIRHETRLNFYLTRLGGCVSVSPLPTLVCSVIL